MITNRLKFYNVDQSASLPQPSAITAYTVVKASRGSTVPMFFEANNSSGILQWLGTPSSTYPGVQEVLDFNQTYGVWVSAPGGTVYATGPSGNGLGIGPSPNTAGVPTYTQFDWDNLYSYFGGVYLTTLGSFEPFRSVSEDLTSGNPVLTSTSNYNTLVTAGNTSSPFSNTTTAATFSLTSGAGGTPGIMIDKINPNYFSPANVNGIIISYPRQDGSTARINIIFHASSTTQLDAIPPNVATPTPVTAIGLLGASPSSLGSNAYSIRIGASSTYTSGYTSSLITGDASGGKDMNWANAGDLRTYMLGVPITCQWSYNIAPYVIMAFHQSTPRASIGTFQVNWVDTRQTLYNSVTTNTYTFTVAGGATAGTICICGTTFTIPLSALTTAASLATYLGTLSVTGGYTLSSVALSGILTIKTTNSQTLPPTVFIPPTSAMTGTTWTTASSGTGSVTNPYYNTINFSYSETSYSGQVYSATYTVSPNSNGVDSQGNNIFAQTALANDLFINADITPLQQIYNMASTLIIPTVTAPTTIPVTFAVPTIAQISGTRAVSSANFTNSYTNFTASTSMLDSVLVNGWNLATSVDYQNTQLFFDPECDDNMPTTFANLRSNYYNFATFVTGIRVADGIANSQTALSLVAADIVTKRSTYPSITGLAYYCNEFLQTEQYNGTSYWNVPIGSICAMLASIMDTRLGGAAPMFYNENSVGGQLNKAVKKQKYPFDANSLDTLDANGINPVILDPFAGLMITSQRTAQSPINLTDWSYLGHSMAFDLFRAEIKQDVMLPQIGKMIDNYHLTLRHQQCQTILNKRLTGTTAIWTDGKIDVETVNTPETLAQNIFMIRIRVKVTPFSEYVSMTFVNVGQQFSIT